MSPAEKHAATPPNAVSLGELEERVMNILWDATRPMTAREVSALVVRDHAVAQITVVTVCNRLVAKGLLAREKRGAYLHYEPALDREAFARQASHEILERIARLGSRALSASIVDVLADYDPEQLAVLRELVRAKLGATAPTHERDHDEE